MKSAFQGTAKSAHMRKEKSKNNAFAAKPKGLTNGPAKSGHVVLRGIAAEQSDWGKHYKSTQNLSSK